MRKWGFLITAFYALILVILIIPGLLVMSEGWSWSTILDIYSHWLPWVCIGILIGGQAALLLVSVDTSWKRLKPRQHIGVSIATVALLSGILIFAAVSSLFAAVYGDGSSNGYQFLMWWFGLWLLWGVVFFLYAGRLSQRVNRAAGWLIKGSVLELLIAVSCHVIVRHREDCSAPAVTSFGIATGMAIMLLSFGPSVLFLCKKRMKQYER
jgi:hypothetical protein